MTKKPAQLPTLNVYKGTDGQWYEGTPPPVVEQPKALPIQPVAPTIPIQTINEPVKPLPLIDWRVWGGWMFAGFSWAFFIIIIVLKLGVRI